MSQVEQEVIIGIDLGTTNSEVAVVHHGKAIVLKVDGSQIIPSVISIDNQNQILIGKAAVNNELMAPTHTIRAIKRKMGLEELVALGGQFYTPPMISSLILKRLKLAAEEFLNQPVKKAVITVPAFFNERQREATKEAAELAGLEPVRLLNEPTAAALAYSLGKHQNESCLIYDLGGGTFDVSIVNLSSEMMEVKASHGDTELGSSDFDKMIADKARQHFIHENGIDLAKDPLAWIRLLRAAEAAKIRLSTEASAKVIEEFIATQNETPLHLTFEITRNEFEDMIRPALERTLISVRMALEMASLSASDIQRVILVGGATYTPLVSQMLEQELKITPQAWLDPSTVVAMGAAIEAASLAGQSIGPLMVDITPHSLGTACLNASGDLFNCILIRRNTPLPYSASKVFYKVFDDQDIIEVQVYQGESTQIHQNQLLGQFRLEGLEDSPGREIHIKFHLDRSGLLHVTATDISTGKKASQVLKKMSGSRLKHANLANLESVKINTEILEDLEDEFENQLLLENIESVEEDFNDEQDKILVLMEEHKDIQAAQALLETQQLDPIDKEELFRELERARLGDSEALQRLSNLLYYLG